MKKSKYRSTGVITAGLLFMAVSVQGHADTTGTINNYSKIKPTRIAGETAETLSAYKLGCPDCVKVAQDIASMRQQYCADRTANVNSVIAGDPVYGYLNGIRIVLSGQGGYSSPMYSSARQVVEANVDCVNAQDWISRSQKVLTQTFNNGQPLG